MTQEPVQLVPDKSDADMASDLRSKLMPILVQASAVVQEGRDKGFIISFNISPDQFGRVRVQTVDIVKPL